jgi:hypothetical protein
MSYRPKFSGCSEIRTKNKNGVCKRGTRYKSEVEGSIPDDIIGIFIDLIFPAALWSWSWLNLEQDWVSGLSHGG